jgi:hypothetical protein
VRRAGGSRTAAASICCTTHPSATAVAWSWRKRVWRCIRAGLRDGDLHRDARLGAAAGAADPPGGDLGADALSDDDTTVAALARRLDVDWHTLWDALEGEARRRAEHPDGCTAWSPSGSMSTSGGPAGSAPAGR